MCLTRNHAEWVSQSADQCRWRYRRGLACSPLQLSTSEPSAILTAIESFPAHRLRSKIHGKAKLIHRLPGMLTAVVAHPPLCRLIPRSRLTRRYRQSAGVCQQPTQASRFGPLSSDTNATGRNQDGHGCPVRVDCAMAITAAGLIGWPKSKPSLALGTAE